MKKIKETIEQNLQKNTALIQTEMLRTIKMEKTQTNNPTANNLVI